MHAHSLGSLHANAALGNHLNGSRNDVKVRKRHSVKHVEGWLYVCALAHGVVG